MPLVLASLLALVSAACMRSWGGHLPHALWLPTALLVAAAGLMWHRQLASQLFARAVLWSNLILGGLITVLGSDRERTVALVLLGATAGALLLLGRRGLDEKTPGAFAPVAFRRTLLALMVMALADAQTLLLFATLSFEDSFVHASRAATYLALGGGLVLGIVGLYRLRVWGLLLHAASCGALIALALLGALQLPVELGWALAATAIAQLVISAPLAFALVRGRRCAVA
jgi:hypothetical protein